MSDNNKKTTQAAGGHQAQGYPLDHYTAQPQGNSEGDKSSYYKSQAPSITLPKGGGALKSIDEKFSVNAVNGTAGLSVGLPFTSGREGFTPSLSLSYNSGSGNGIFGLGWDLGLPSIQRRTDKKLPEYDDSTESDVFVLAGAEDLVPVLDENGNPVIDTTQSPYTIRSYRPRIEGLFARIEFISKTGSTHKWWRVTTKDNIVTWYGLDANGCIADPADESRIFKWLPQLITDHKGNVQHFIYAAENNVNVAATAHERNRLNGLAPFTNRYLKQVRYCNLTPFKYPAAQDPDNPVSPATLIYEPAMPAAALADDFMMEAVFDFDEYSDTEPVYLPDQGWACRTDAFSDFHAGFEIRTYRKCKRVLFVHRFKELGDNVHYAPIPVRALEFTYRNDGSTVYTEADLITAVKHTEYRQKADNSWSIKSLPALEMTYQPLQWNENIQAVSPDNVTNAPQGLTGAYQWVDLWGEGLPGILTEQGSGWFYKSNLGNGKFTEAVPVAEKPSFTGFGNVLQWQDLEADGRRQLVSHDPAMPGYFELDDNQEWQPFRAFKEWVNVDWNSQFTKMLDLNGDGRPDLLLTDDRVWTWYNNAGTDGMTEGGTRRTVFDEEKGPRLVLNDYVQSIFLADMNGDGMTDIVRIKNGEVCYWPNLGYGRFGAKITMSSAPVFDQPDMFNPVYLHIADVSGTGAADIIYLGRNKCTAWINLAGNAWSEAKELATLPGIDTFSTIAVLDFLGNGTSCIVWSSPLPQYSTAPLRYIDLMGGVKPYIMTGFTNNLGKITSLEYKSSSQYYLEDKAAGYPWATRLPFPVQCLSRVTTQDLVSETTYTQTYSYHHGYYDHEEREFRGFGRVDVTDVDAAKAYMTGTTTENDLDQAPVLTKTWYHTGAWLRESTLLDRYELEYFSWNGSVLLPSVIETVATPLNAQETREAHRALKGTALRQEVYALDGIANDIPYSVTSTSHTVRRIQVQGPNRYASFLAYQQQSFGWTCERNPDDARLQQSLTLAIDSYGNVIESAQVGYARKVIPGSLPQVVKDEQAKTHIVCSSTDYTNDVIDASNYRLRVSFQECSYELFPGPADITEGYWTPDNLIGVFENSDDIAFTDNPSGTWYQRKKLSHHRTLFRDNDGVSVLDPGVIASLGLPFEQYTQAFAADIINKAYDTRVTDALLQEGGYINSGSMSAFIDYGDPQDWWWVRGGVAGFGYGNPADSFYQPMVYTDPWDYDTTVTYWGNYYLLPETVTDAASNTSTIERYNWRSLQPERIRDMNDNIGETIYDTLCFAVIYAEKGKDDGTEGDTLYKSDGSALLDPDNTSDVLNQADFWNDPEANAPYLLGRATWRCLYKMDTWPVASAMIGREEHYADVKASQLINPAYPDSPVLIRVSYTDGMGRVAMHKAQATDDPDTLSVRWTGSGKTIYNNKGSVVLQYEPYFSTTHAYDPAQQAAVLGVSPRMHYDPLGRAYRTDMPDGTYTKMVWDNWSQASWDANDTVLDSAWYAARTGTGSLSGIAEESAAAIKAAAHAGTPSVVHLDSLGRSFYTIQQYRQVNTSVLNDDPFYRSYIVLDILGDHTEVHDARGLLQLQYKYNMLKAPLRQISIDGGIGRTLMDAAGQPLCTWDAEDRRTHITYDMLRRPLSKDFTLPSAASSSTLEHITYGEGAGTYIGDDKKYNLRGKAVQTYDSAGYHYVQAYDFNGVPVQSFTQLLQDHTIADPDWSFPPLLSTEVFSTVQHYDAFGRVITEVDPGGNKTRNVYDKSGMLSSVFFTKAGSTTEVAYVTGMLHDAKGQRQAIWYGNGTKTSYTYDPQTYRLRRLQTIKTADGTQLQDLNYFYDPSGNITQITDKTFNTVTQTQAVYFNNTVINPVQQFTYDALYRLIEATGREKAGTATMGTTDNFADNDWSGISFKGDGNALQSYTQSYTYDAAGNIQQLQHSAASGGYTRNYSYQSGANRLSGTVIGSSPSTPYSYSYDAHGNMTGMPHLSTMQWNVRQELWKAGNGTVTSYYQYSGGHRVSKYVDKGNVKELRLYMGNYELYRRYDSGTLSIERATMHLSDDMGRIAMVEVLKQNNTGNSANGTAGDTLQRYVYGNHLGSASLELDGSAAIISYEEYHPYGTTSYQAVNSSITATSKRYRFTGKERDEETGLYYHGARYYAPWLGRWTAVDPLESQMHGWSSYNYAYCNPIIWIDPDGQSPDTHHRAAHSHHHQAHHKPHQTFIIPKLDIKSFLDPAKLHPVDHTGHAPFIIAPLHLKPADPKGANGAANGYYYSRDGKYIGHFGKSEEVFTADKVTNGTAENAIDLHVKHDTFLRFASAVNNETAGSLQESIGIAHAFLNFVRLKNDSKWSLENVVSKPNAYSFGVSKVHFDEFMKLYNAPSNKKKSNEHKEFANRKHAVEGVIQALSGGEDITHGAFLWDGGDIAQKGFSNADYNNSKSHRSYGLSINSTLLNQFNNKWRGRLKDDFIPLESRASKTGEYKQLGTAVFGGTIFFKEYDSKALKGLLKKGYLKKPSF